MKNIIIILLCFSLVLFMPTTSYATSLEDSEIDSFKSIKQYTEFEWIEQLQSMSDRNLIAQGLSQAEISELRDFSYEEALLERASHSVDELRAFGYTDEQINILKSYDGSEITSNSPVLAASSTCTGIVSHKGYNTTTGKIKFTYSFSWDAVPLWQHTDRISVSWQAVNENALTISCSASTKSATINYYSNATGDYLYTKNPTLSIVPGFNGYYASYYVCEAYEDPTVTYWAWAKTGSITIELVPDGDAVINVVKVYGAVGHHYYGQSVSFSYSGGAQPWSFSYSPASQIQTLATASYTLGSNGSCVSNQ